MIYFYTFGSKNYEPRVQGIITEATNSKYFDKVIGFGESDLQENIKQYCDQYSGSTIGSRGYGFWIWKPYITQLMMDKVGENDIICYADAGCTINPKAKTRFDEYIKMVTENDNVSFGMGLTEKEWTKNDTFEHFKSGNDIKDSGQLCATAFIIRKCDHTRMMVDLWKDIMFHHRNLIDDSPSTTPNDIHFKENRHDQSIWSIIRKTLGTVLLTDETNSSNEGYPFHATRRK